MSRNRVLKSSPGRRAWRARIAVAGILSIFSITGRAPAAQFTPFEAAIAAFDAEVAAAVAEDAAGCVTVAVFIGDEVIWAKGYGWADIENRIAATPETIGRTGSISKSFTAVLMMQLIERGVFGLDEPVVDVFPEFDGLAGRPAAGAAVTFRMLASHTAGLVREPELPGAASGPIYGWEEKILESIPNIRFQTAPATEYSYSNIGYGILGLASSRAAGVPFMDLVTDLIFSPLGMSSSTFIVNTPRLAERLSVGYSRRRVRDPETGEVIGSEVSAEQATREHFGRGYKVPNGGVYSTVLDLAKFAAAMMGESRVAILSDESRAEMLEPQAPAEGYGLGFMVRSGDDSITTVGHGGSVAGYNAGLRFELDSKIGVAMLRTTSYDPPIETLLRTLVAAGGGE